MALLRFLFCWWIGTAVVMGLLFFAFAPASGGDGWVLFSFLGGLLPAVWLYRVNERWRLRSQVRREVLLEQERQRLRGKPAASERA